VKLLVAIASYGEKNLSFLKKIITTYQAMAMTVDVVVTSEAPKDLPAGVRVEVGLPSKNPRSLPFAHKKIFAENVDRYDLFIYSEDDIDVTEAHVQGFLRATEVLKPDEIAGFLRYEKDASGSVWMSDVHNMFHWKPESVVHRGALTFAEYTNEHAAFYMMTQAQLRRAVASGGYLQDAYRGRYSMLETAATDPYTSCGLRKVICISHLDQFMVHHMSNAYAGKMGLPLRSFEEQLETLNTIDRGGHLATTLCEVESTLPEAEWSKSFYEKPHQALMEAVPRNVKSVLSIGCGWGVTEAELKQRGADVTVLPLDSVIGAAAARLGVNPVYGRLDECLTRLGGQTYDCVLITNLLHLQRDPEELFNRCAQFVREGGALVVDTPNFHRLATLAKRMSGNGQFKGLRSFAESGVTTFGPRMLVRASKSAGLSAPEVCWYDHSFPRTLGLKSLPWRMGRFTAGSWVFRAIRQLAA
jgi:2-polyprenyl-3-methyl-5-hydroxy-6-metoxy-1,4-benzoquinol methylase